MHIFLCGLFAIGIVYFWIESRHWMAKLLMFLPLAAILGFACAVLSGLGTPNGNGGMGFILGAVAALAITWIPTWVREARQLNDASLELTLRD